MDKTVIEINQTKIHQWKWLISYLPEHKVEKLILPHFLQQALETQHSFETVPHAKEHTHCSIYWLTLPSYSYIEVLWLKLAL